jgi:nucleoside-diphosphate-sugar epimerase
MAHVLLADQVHEVAVRLPHGATVINAAGLSDSGSGDEVALATANGALPGVLAAATASVDGRFVHISSAAVQGRSTRLDSSERTAPFSAYSRSKVCGELAATAANSRTVVYRPPGVHAPGRAVTQRIAALARSRFSSTAGPGTANTAQALLENVGDACAHLALTGSEPPHIVAHPSEGLTTSSLLELLGGHPPVHLPWPVAKGLVAVAFAGGRMSTRLAANVRRAEMLLFGQEQDESWLTLDGWAQPYGQDRWAEIGHVLRAASNGKEHR